MPSQIPVPPGGDQRHGYILLVPAIIIFILSALAVVARLYVRLHIRPKLGWDDYTMFAAFVDYLYSHCWQTIPNVFSSSPASDSPVPFCR